MCTQLTINDKETEDVRGSITESIKISRNFHAEFLRLLHKAEKKRNFELLSKENALERKSQEKQAGTSKLEEDLQLLKKKEKKIM